MTSTTSPSTSPSTSPTTSSAQAQLGAYGEALAARHLTRREGMTLLDRNFRCSHGEIDLVLRDAGVLVVCEVKTRSTQRFGHPLEQVPPEKIERLQVIAACWCEARGMRPRDVRIDVVGVLVGRGPVEVVHSRGWGCER